MKNKRLRNLIILVLVILIAIVTFVVIANKKDNSKKENMVKKEDIVKKEVPKAPSNKFGYQEEGSNIIKSAQSYAVPANDVYKMLATKDPVNDEKEVFLTFDDGPSKNTKEILNILKENGVHGTFFVMGSNLKELEENREYLKEEYEDGNAIANHTFTHSYHKLYPGNSVNVDYFMSELKETDDLMRTILGPQFNTRVLRMPGGYMSRQVYHDKNLKALNEALNETKIVSIDWDSETGDATGKKLSTAQMLNNVIKDTKNEKHVILLMHDSATKKQTVKALPSIINYFKKEGYSFKVIENAPDDAFKNIEGNSTSNGQIVK